MHQIFLLPGFFGFTHLGEIVYFGHVRDFLMREYARRGIPASVIAVKSHPTASIRTRARDALDAMVAGASGEGPIHLVGHSTGGLDARLLLSPNADLPDPPPPAGLLDRVQTLVTVGTPHRGTPLATFFLGVAGRQLLQLLTLFTSVVLREKRLPLRQLFRAASAFVRLDDALLPPSTVDALFSDLLGDFSEERRAAVAAFMKEVSSDQTLMGQLTPEAVELFSTTTRDRPGVRYGSVVARAPRPSLRSRMSAGMTPYAQATHTVYSLLHGRVARGDRQSLKPTEEQQVMLRAFYGAEPTHQDSDGIVPTLSQPYGQLLHAAIADHLDTIGHFDAPRRDPPHYDWLTSGSGFNRQAFEDLWQKVVDYQLSA